MKKPNDITTKIADIMNDEICEICRELNVSSFKEPVVANCRWILASDIKVGCYQDIPEEVFFHIDCNNTWCGNYIVDRLIDRLAENKINLYLIRPEYYTIKSGEAIEKSNYVVYNASCDGMTQASCDHRDGNNKSMLLSHTDGGYVCPVCGERGKINHPPVNCKVCKKFGSCGKSFELNGRDYKIFRKGWKAALYAKESEHSEYSDKKYAEISRCWKEDNEKTRQNSIIIALNKKTKRR